MQRRVLTRARGLATFSDALATAAIAGGPLITRRRLIVVPTRSAAELLRQTIERRLSRGESGAATVQPDFVTRDDWYRRMHQCAAAGRRRLTRIEREVLFERAAIAVADRRCMTPPFHLRPGLVSTILDFYDELQRRQRTTRRFARAIFDELRVERGTDRGSEGLIDQTRFLGFTFLAYERAVEASEGLDEHALRRRLLADPAAALDFNELIVAVADHPADPSGLWPVDFDLAGRLAGIATVRIVMTDEAHDAGFRDRLERELPGVEEERWPYVPATPVIVVPPVPDASMVQISRDREEEMRDVARVIRQRAAESGERPASTVAIVFHRPLPYLYLSQQVLADARIPYQAFDALPLAAEPYAALLDLVLTLARTGGTRGPAIELLRSRLLEILVGGARVRRREVSALDAVLVDRRAAGDASTVLDEVEAYARRAGGGRGPDVMAARRAARALVQIASELAAFRQSDTASAQVGTIERFLRQYERPVTGVNDGADRHRRARAAVLAVLTDLADAFRRHDDRRREPDRLAAMIHHAIEARTFAPRHGDGGVHLVDRVAAKFGVFTDCHLVGLVETDWSDRPRRNVLYSTGLLKSLGWPQDTDQALAQQAAFTDVLTLARERTRLSAFQLEGDALVALTPLVELARALPTAAETRPARGTLFPDEVLTVGDGRVTGLDERTAAWLEARRGRPPAGHPAYAGAVGPRTSTEYRVSRVDSYVTCPFKYFASDVLRLPEDRLTVSGMTPIERGLLLHSLFERFYAEWQASGHGAIAPDTLGEALALFGRITHEALLELPEADRVLEAMRLLGSLVTRGVAERVFELEIAAGAGVRRRLLEVDLVGSFVFPSRLGFETRTIAIRGKADRVDVLDDGSLRVVDYKLGRMPDVERSIQVAVYAYCARQQMESAEGRPHPIASASYLAFGDDRRFEGRIGEKGEPAALAVETRALAFSHAVGQIESGQFPPRPASTAECAWCGYAGVCRKEYRMEADETAEPV
jgi:RecB family exonuclease